MRLNVTPRANVDAEVARWYREIARQVNALSEGQQVAFYNAATTVPTAGTWQLGDFVLNKAPAELGTATAKYLIHGWRCTVSGTPGTWLECRFLTGN
jgi:hypothetical protein